VVDELVRDVVGHRDDARAREHPFLLAEEPGRVAADPQEPQPRRRRPRAVQVARQQDHGHVARDVVEHRGGGLLGPPGPAEAEPDQRLPDGGRRGRGVVERRVHHGRGVGGARRGRHVEAPAHERPLGEVHVRVPQPRDHGAAVEVDALGRGPRRTNSGTGGNHGAHPAALEQHVDEAVRPPGEARVHQQQCGHGHTVDRRAAALSTV
jgi:hypothetical protein